MSNTGGRRYGLCPSFGGCVNLKELLDTRLPLNRKERYFTGTVFPMIVASGEFASLQKFLDLAHVEHCEIVATSDSTNVEFFTEYGFLESLKGVTAERFPTTPAGRDTPDIIIYIEGSPSALIGIEAKMYDRPTAAELEVQLGVQRTLLEGIAADLAVETKVTQVALLPAQLASEVGQLSVPTVTWQQVLDAYATVAPPYWTAMLGEALDRYGELVGSRSRFGENREAVLTGLAIIHGHDAGTLKYGWIGRKRGLDGPELEEDITTGAWQTRSYEVRFTALPGNRNWFSVGDFVARIKANESR